MQAPLEQAPLEQAPLEPKEPLGPLMLEVERLRAAVGRCLVRGSRAVHFDLVPSFQINVSSFAQQAWFLPRVLAQERRFQEG